MIKDPLFIVLADGHHNSLGLVRSLGKAGYTPIVFLIGKQNAIIRHSKYVKTLVDCNSVEQALSIIIKEYSHIATHRFILTGNDKFVSAIDNNYDILSKSFITYNCGERGALNKLLSKSVQNILAMEAQLNVPKFAIVTVKEHKIPNIPFPVITKAINSIGKHWKDVVYLCKNEDDLLAVYNQIDCEQIIVQSYIEKANETGFNGISINGGEEVYLPLQLSYKSTTDITFGNSIKLDLPTSDTLIERVKRLIRLTNYSGSFSVDFVVGKDGKIYFLEINFRNSGWSFPYTRAGVNLPALWAESMVNGHIDAAGVKFKKLPFTVADEFLEVYDSFKKGFFNALSTLLSLRHYDALIYLDKEDKKPFIKLVSNTLKSHLVKHRQ